MMHSVGVAHINMEDATQVKYTLQEGLSNVHLDFSSAHVHSIKASSPAHRTVLAACLMAHPRRSFHAASTR